MPTSDDLRQRAATLRAEADEHERQAAINRGDAARLEETADRLDRAATDALARAGLSSGTDDGTVGAMETSPELEFRPGIPGKAPAKPSLVAEAAKATKKSIRQLARDLGVKEDTLKKMSSRGRVNPELATKLTAMIQAARLPKRPPKK